MYISKMKLLNQVTKSGRPWALIKGTFITTSLLNIVSHLGDSLAHVNGSFFGTPDADNDNHSKANCAGGSGAGWWYNKCYNANLNGIYRKDSKDDSSSFVWYHWGNSWRSLKSSVMMIRQTPGA